MKRPNRYSHAFVLSNYSNNGLIDPSSPFQEEPPFPISIRSPYNPIARPARFTLTNLPSLTESASVPKTGDQTQGGDTTGRAAELRDEAKVRRSNSVVTQIYAPDGGVTPPVPEIGNSLATEALPEERTLTTNTTIKQRPDSEAATSHRHDESIATQIYSPMEQPTFSPPKTPPPRTASTRRKNLEATASSHETAAVKGLTSRYKHEVPRSWVSFGGQGSRYWKPLPLEPSLVPYKLPGSGDLEAHSCELEQEKVSSKRNSNESASTTSTSSALSHQNDTPCTSPSTTLPSLASSLISRKEPASTTSPRSRIPVLASRRSSIDQDKKMGHRRISSQLSEDFRVIDDLTMESLMRSPPRDSGDEVDGYYSKEKKHSIGGQEEDDDDGGENWLYPPTGPEIFCTPPKSVSFPSSRPTTPTRKRSSFPRQHRPQTSRLPSQASFSGFSDSAPARNDAIADDRQTSDSEDSAVPPPISFGARPERPVSMSIDKRGPSFRDFMSGRKDRSAAMSGGGNEQPSTSASSNSDGKRSRTSSLTAFISGLSRRASTSESVAAAKRAEEMKQRAGIRKSSEEDKKEEEKEKEGVPAENTTPTKSSDQPRESEKKRKGKEKEKGKHNVPAKDSIPTKPSNRPHSSLPPPTPPARKSSLEKTKKSRPTSTKTEQKTARYRDSWGCGDKPLVTVLDYTAENIATSPPIPPRWQIDAETTKPIIPPIDDTKATTNANTNANANDNNAKTEKKHNQQQQPSSSFLLSATASAKSIKAWRINRFNAKRNLGMGNKKQQHHHQWVK